MTANTLSTFQVGATVRCTHDEAKCRLRKTDCVYGAVVGKLGTVVEVYQAQAWRPQRHGEAPSIRVAFIGRESVHVVPIDQIELAGDVTAEEMLDNWQGDMDRVSAHAERNMKYYDDAPDGSKQKQSALNTMDYLSLRRRLIERAFDILVP
jgi:hypothetical protein